MLSPAMD
jgi:hypothetical protein